MTEFIAANIPVAYIEADGSYVEDDTAAAAAYLSWIAYPRRNQVQRATRLIEAVRVIPFKKVGKHPPRELRGVKRDKIDGSIRDAMNSIARRWPAKWMAMKMLGMDERWPQGTLSVSEAATLACDPVGTFDDEMGAIVEDGEPRKVAERIWRDSLPALAMLMALPEPRERRIEWLQNPDWLPSAVDFANSIAPRLAARFDAKAMFIPRLIAVQD
jgi:hypothetical protein